MDKETELIKQLFLSDKSLFQQLESIVSEVQSVSEYMDEHRMAYEIPEEEFMAKLEDLQAASIDLQNVILSLEPKIDEYYDEITDYHLNNDDD